MELNSGVSSLTMAKVETLYKLCMKKMIKEKLLHYPLDIRNIPHTIFENLWDAQKMMNLQEEERSVYNMIMVLNSEYNDAVLLFNHHCDIYDKIEVEMDKIERVFPQDENLPPPPIIEKMRSEREIMFNKLFNKFSDIDDKMMEIDTQTMTKCGKLDVIVKELKKQHSRFNIKFNLDDDFELQLDAELERIMSIHNRRINQNRIFLHHAEGG